MTTSPPSAGIRSCAETETAIRRNTAVNTVNLDSMIPPCLQ